MRARECEARMAEARRDRMEVKTRKDERRNNNFNTLSMNLSRISLLDINIHKIIDHYFFFLYNMLLSLCTLFTVYIILTLRIRRSHVRTVSGALTIPYVVRIYGFSFKEGHIQG